MISGCKLWTLILWGALASLSCVMFVIRLHEGNYIKAIIHLGFAIFFLTIQKWNDKE